MPYYYLCVTVTHTSLEGLFLTLDGQVAEGTSIFFF